MAYFQHDESNEQSKRVPPPTRAPVDMENDLESGACAMAQAFYQQFGHEATQINDRRQLGVFFASKQHLLLEDPELYAACTKNGREDARRHWSQVLFSLCRHGKVLKVGGGGSWIEWNTQHMTPETLQIAKVIADTPILLQVFRKCISVGDTSGDTSVSVPPSSPATLEDEMERSRARAEALTAEVLDMIEREEIITKQREAEAEAAYALIGLRQAV